MNSSTVSKLSTLWDKIVLPLAILMLSAIAVGIYFENRTDKREAEELATRGITTIGSLGGTYRQRNTFGRSEYEITYTFEIDGHKYAKTVTVDQRPETSAVKVIYLPTNPDTSRLVDFSRRTHWEDAFYA